MWELSRSFGFEAAHTLARAVAREASLRVHGHSYRAEVTLRGVPDASGMVVDLGVFAEKLAAVRAALDHRMLDEVPGLAPATLENLAAYIWRALAEDMPQLARVSVHRDSLQETCTYFGPAP